MSEALLLAALHGIGLAYLMATGAVPPLGATFLAVPTGIGVYTAAGLLLLALRIPFSVPAALAVAAATAIAFAATRRPRPRRGLVIGLVGAAAVVALSLAVQATNLTRMTPDSYDYLAVAATLDDHGSVEDIPDTTLAKRSVVVPFLHVGAGDDLARTSMAPVVALTGMGALLWLLARALRKARTPRPWALALLAAAAFLVPATQHTSFHLFYVNSHFLVAVALLVVAVSGWTAVTEQDGRWALLALPALVVALAARPEGPLVAALFLVPWITATRSRPVVATVAATTAVWHLAVLAPAVGISDSAVVSGLVVAAGLAAVVLVARQPWARHVPVLMVAALALVLLAALAVDFDVMRRSATATIDNLFLDDEGRWGLTWWVLPPVGLAVLAAAPIPWAAYWRTSLVGFALLWGSLPVLRDGAYRVGLGDSGNRILVHVLLVGLFVLALGAGTLVAGDE